ncbi:hypothetical protein K435DRAFT_864631 [Dendrothele bispora CBS 962.96]|uniref:Uncharacterized protein n=1 Tax=Dendrothele bispora (strain CBS 962.96) TaxID=1314807 RepID=A0A4S8LM22_DENBC|nr:hypothetical protein K435DRAFT_864631 [Dendrothele bispora CBS 962.96]
MSSPTETLSSGSPAAMDTDAVMADTHEPNPLDSYQRFPSIVAAIALINTHPDAPPTNVDTIKTYRPSEFRPGAFQITHGSTGLHIRVDMIQARIAIPLAYCHTGSLGEI